MELETENFNLIWAFLKKTSYKKLLVKLNTKLLFSYSNAESIPLNCLGRTMNLTFFPHQKVSQSVANCLIIILNESILVPSKPKCLDSTAWTAKNSQSHTLFSIYFSSNDCRVFHPYYKITNIQPLQPVASVDWFVVVCFAPAWGDSQTIICREMENVCCDDGFLILFLYELLCNLWINNEKLFI